MRVKKLGKTTSARLALIRNQATNLLWYGKIETTEARAKSVRSYAEKLLTLAINSFEDVVTVTKTVVDDKGNKSTKEVVNDGPKKLAARRKLMAKLYKVEEQRLPGEKKADFITRKDNIQNPLIEKIFNIYAPKYAARNKENGIGGGYTRILKIGKRTGDNADMVIVELI